MCKKLIYLISFVLVLSVAGPAEAVDNYWTNGAGTGIWNDAGNWSLGHVPAYGDEEKQFIDSVPGPVVESAGMGAYKLRMSETSALTIEGGELSASSEAIIGNTKGGTSTVTVNSGTLKFDATVNVGKEGTGILNMNGGAFIADKLKVGTHSAGNGHVNLDEGVITVTNKFAMVTVSGAVGTMNVTGGTLIVDGDVVSLLQGYIDDPNGWITADDGTSTPQLDYGVTNAGKTTLRGGHFLKPNPADGSTVMAVTVNELQWTLPETGPSGGDVTCVVYFGTNPVVEENPIVVGDPDPEAVESVPVTLAIDTVYYWALDLYDSNSSTPDSPYLLCPVFTFTTIGNMPPIVNAGDDVTTWPDDGERVVELDGTVSDEYGGPGPATLVWTVIAEPNELNPAWISDPNVANTTVTVKEPGTYTLQLEAGDGEYTVTDTMQIVLYADSCLHARSQPGFVRLEYDRHYDCKVDFLDLAGLAAEWLKQNYSTE